MSQVSPVLRRATDGYLHWCPGCGEMHLVPDRWTFNGDVARPTFSPSIKITGKQCVIENGRWTGEWKRGANGEALDGCCHYHIEDGQIKFCGDCTHALAGVTVPLPLLSSVDAED